MVTETTTNTVLSTTIPRFLSNGNEGSVVNIAVDRIAVPEYQRSIQPSVQRKIRNDGWSPIMCQTLTVSHRDGTYWIVDGLQRVTAARELDVPTVPCQVWHNLSYEEEAMLFRMMNTARKSIGQVDIFHAAIEGKESWALSIRDIAKECGYNIVERDSTANTTTPNLLHCVATIVRLWERGEKTEMGPEKLLRRVLTIAHDGFQEEHRSIPHDIIVGIQGVVINNPTMRDNFLIQRLQAQGHSVATITHEARKIAVLSHIDARSAIGVVLRNIYNNRLSEKRRIGQ